MSNKIGNAYGLKNTADESYTLIIQMVEVVLIIVCLLLMMW